jgi:class 3 adenylate cyclase
MKEGPPAATTAETRRLAAIMFTDIVGFSRQMGSNEARTLRLLEVHNHVIQQAVTEHHGHVIKTVGDAFLVDFPYGRPRRAMRAVYSRSVPYPQC